MKGNSMSLEDIKREWRNEMDRSISASELEDLLNVVQRRCAGLEHTIHRRDIREILAASSLSAHSPPCGHSTDLRPWQFSVSR